MSHITTIISTMMANIDTMIHIATVTHNNISLL